MNCHISEGNSEIRVATQSYHQSIQLTEGELFMPEVVVFDLETTGFGQSDRIVEIAGVLWDTESDAVIGEFESLINPERNISAEVSAIHGLRAEHLSSAPTFREIADWLVHLFDRRPVITHNANFDLRMLNQEFERAGLEFRISQAGCTLMATGKRLELACADIGYDLLDAHSALVDARGALAIARSIGADYFLDAMNRTPHRSSQGSNSMPRTLSRSQLGLTEIVEGFRSLPRRIEFEGSPIEYYYLAFFDEVLDDMKVTAEELADLNAIAAEAGLSSTDVNELHRTYLAHLEQAALRDNRVTPEEMDLISQFAALIGVKPTVEITKGIARTELRKDLLICATGTAIIDGRDIPKDELARIVEEHGHRFTDTLTKKAGVNLLLVDSYGTQSGKAQQALRWGIPVLSVADYLGQS